MNASGSTSTGLCWGWIAGPGGVTTRRRGSHGLSFESVEGVTTGGGIDREHHSAGTVTTLGTVNPHWGRGIHTDGVSGEGGGIGTNGLEPRIKAISHGTTRSGEGRLSSGVVLLMELEGDSVSRLGSDCVRLECENASTANDNTVVRTTGGIGGS